MRRSLLSQLAAAMAGVAFTSCHVRPAVGQVGRRREVIVNGKRVRTVDVHAHCHIPEATALAGYKETTPALIIGPERIRAMDEQGIDIEALSINPNFWDKAERDLQAQIVKVQNEKLVADGDCRADYRSALVGPAVLWPDEASAQFGPCGGDGMTNAAPSRTRRNGTVRCAIYTRKSSEEGLEQEFNSLQAQREACEAFTASQRHEGWVCLRAGYDDGGFSGATIERPALRRLLADIAAGRVDTIVVYKIDRLTRSLADFAKIVEILDARGASFVSVTGGLGLLASPKTGSPTPRPRRLKRNRKFVDSPLEGSGFELRVPLPEKRRSDTHHSIRTGAPWPAGVAPTPERESASLLR